MSRYEELDLPIDPEFAEIVEYCGDTIELRAGYAPGSTERAIIDFMSSSASGEILEQHPEITPRDPAFWADKARKVANVFREEAQEAEPEDALYE